jgi:predicted ester cyclase
MSDDQRKETLLKALRAGLTGEVDGLQGVFTDDVMGWSPNLSVSSLAELHEAFAERDESLDDIVFAVDAMDSVGDKVIAEWRVSAVHAGPVRIGDDLVVEPTGNQVTLAGATFAEFRGERIAAFRSYFDDAAILEQMLAPD